MELAPKTLLKERYEVIRKLGQGGMGAVYMAHDVVLEEVVAVKANRNPLPQSSNLFLREARLLATLRHPNLPRVTDYFIIDEIQYLVMDYIPGDDLNVIIKETGVQPLDMVLLWAEQIGSALVYLHNQNPPVVHRDIKPGNIKLMPSGEVMLVDFGIAKSNDPSQATTTGMTGFTPGYAPPEQYGTAHTGTYTDQYALAATLYHLLTNQHPVDSLQRIMGTAVLTPMNLLNPKIPAPIQAAIEKAMSLHPEERFPDVEEFLKDAAARKDWWDVVVVDPPALIPTRQAVSKGVNAYIAINRAALRVVAPGGMLVTCSCSHLMTREKHLEVIGRAAFQEGRRVRVVAVGGHPPDHPILPGHPETEYLKCWVMQVE